MPMPEKNMFWKDVPLGAKVIEHERYFEIVNNGTHYTAYWGSQDAREAQSFLRKRAMISRAAGNVKRSRRRA